MEMSFESLFYRFPCQHFYSNFHFQVSYHISSKFSLPIIIRPTINYPFLFPKLTEYRLGTYTKSPKLTSVISLSRFTIWDIFDQNVKKNNKC